MPALLQPARPQAVRPGDPRAPRAARQVLVHPAARTAVTPRTAVAQGTALERAPQAAPPVLSPLVAKRPALVPVLSLGQDLVLRTLAFLWVGAMLWFWLWWLAPARGDWSPGRTLATVGLLWLSGLGGYQTFLSCRMTKPNPALKVPRLRVAMVVTKAPSEPWPIVRTTLTAAMAQRFPHDYDIWLADERPSIETLRWCWDHGVQVSSRNGEVDYHRDSWPRRTKSKEGNLAWFYDTVGYQAYDVVAQFDADHVPDPDYLANVVRPFADPNVGYVSAPSICDANAGKSWTVRGRLHREAALHGPAQAGCNGGWAPVCIGSHYTVRTAAIRDVGGIGPDLAEDYTTTLMLQSGGWDGVFALDAIAHGDGPETLRDMLTQEVQWARSLGAVLTRWAPPRARHLRPRAVARLSFALLYYPLQSIFCLIGTGLPLYGVIEHVTWGNAGLGEFYLHIWVCSALLMAMLAWVRRCGVMRPVKAPLWSWEMVLFQLVRWPFVAGGFVQGMWAGLLRRDRPFRVTPKGVQGRPPFTLGMLAPTVVLAALPTATLAAVAQPGRVLGLYLLVAVQAVTYLVVLVSLVVAHLRACSAVIGPLPEGGRHVRPRIAWAMAGRLEIGLLAFVAVCAGVLAVRLMGALGLA